MSSGLGVMDSGMGSTGLAALPSAYTGQIGKMSDSQINQVAKDFESMFIGEMLEPMFDGESVGDSMFGDAASSDVYKGLMMDAYGKQIANAGGIGIADYVKKELLKLQEKS